MFRKLMAVLGALVLCSVVSVAQTPRLDFDPVLQGVWRLHATSSDGGNTIAPADGSVFCRVFATKVRFLDGRELFVNRVLIVTDNSGNPGNMVEFTNGTVWAISKSPGQGLVLVQVFVKQSNGELAETFRAVVSVEE